MQIRLRHFFNSRTFSELLPILLFSILFGLLTFGIPPNMDEFSAYQPIDCRYFPHGSENIYREGCQNYGLTLFGQELPLRSYGYLGSGHALRYFPFFLLWQDFHSARLMGFLALLLIYYVIRHVTSIGRWMGAALVFLCFPLAFQTAIDTGPVGFSLAMVLAIPFFFSRTRDLRVAAGLGFLLFVCFWDKPYFLVTLPSMVGLAILFRRPHPKELQVALVGGAVFLLFSALLLSAQSRSGATFLTELRNSAAQRTAAEQWSYLSHWATYARSFFNFGDKLYDRTGEWDLPTALYWFTTLGAVGTGFFLRGLGRRTLLIWVPLVLATLCLYLLNRTKATYSGHHLIFVFPFLILAFAAAFRILEERYPKVIRIAPILLALAGLFSAIDIIRAPAQSASGWERVALNEVLHSPEIAKNHVIVVVDWGMFYLQALYGDREQLVIYLEPFTENWQVAAVRRLTIRTKRRALFVGRKSSVSNLDLIWKSFPTLTHIPFPTPDNTTSEWFAVAEAP